MPDSNRFHILYGLIAGTCILEMGGGHPAGSTFSGLTTSNGAMWGEEGAIIKENAIIYDNGESV